jgi:hypothetical protein
VTGASANGPGPDRRRRAAFTIVQNEPVFLPLWLAYYGRFFEPCDLYVLDHDSTDGSTHGLEGRCHVVPVHREFTSDHHWLRSTVEAFQASLLERYETVLFAESDEIIVTDPDQYGGLDDYLARLAGPVARCSGFNVVHQPGEPAVDLGRPLLAQRRTWHAAPLFCKTLVSRVPLRWVTGFHHEVSRDEAMPDPHLFLVHLHRLDYSLCQERHRIRAQKKWNPQDVQLGYGTHNMIVEDEAFRKWFYEGPQIADSKPEPIPERLRSVF